MLTYLSTEYDFVKPLVHGPAKRGPPAGRRDRGAKLSARCRSEGPAKRGALAGRPVNSCEAKAVGLAIMVIGWLDRALRVDVPLRLSALPAFLHFVSTPSPFIDEVFSVKKTL